ncbi:MAG TPA: DUF4837 family protein [Ignavibacteriaceae bacterium]|nr:DUF4837 family protein [Ignavibacteriaceae bacterium]
MKKFLILIPFLVGLLILPSCSSQSPARGPEDEIYVVADSIEFEALKPVLESTFEKIINTPQPEKLFILKRISVNGLSRNKNKKNIIIAAPLNSGSVTSDFVSSVVDTAVQKKIIADSNVIVRKYDLWAKNQLVMVLTAPDMESLKSKINRNADDLLYAYQKISDKRLFSSLYNPQYEQEDIEGKLLKSYGWVIYVQADFLVAKNDSLNNFVWLRRSPGSDMERWIFVHWIDNATPLYLNADSVRAIRNRMTKKYYQTMGDKGYVVIADNYYTTSEVNFNGRYALLTQGLWDLNIKGMGGPFVNYTFYDDDTHRIYMLDGSVFAPKYYKRNLIQQMDVTLQSFMTEKKLSADRKEDLLDAATD